MEPKGILRNKEKDAQARNYESLSRDLDRQEVIRNTRYNAHLVSDSSKGDRIRAQIAEARLRNGDGEHSFNEHLKWDEINLYKTEQEKAATMKIDEPKTPYDGGFDPSGEYYQEENVNEAIPDFDLGEGQFASTQEVSKSLNGGEVLRYQDEDDSDDEDEGEDQDIPLLTEERHRLFKEMRNSHYHNAANPLKQKISIPDDDDLDDEDGTEDLNEEDVE